MSETDSGVIASQGIVQSAVVKNNQIVVKFIFVGKSFENNVKTAIITKDNRLYEKALDLKKYDLVYATSCGEYEIISIVFCNVAIVKKRVVTAKKISVEYIFMDDLSSPCPEDYKAVLTSASSEYTDAKALNKGDLIWISEDDFSITSMIYGCYAFISHCRLKNNSAYIGYYIKSKTQNKKSYKKYEVCIS